MRTIARSVADSNDGRGRDVGGVYGANRSIVQPPSTRRYLKRSWRRLSRPCQSSISSGTTRYPPQKVGRGIFPSPNFLFISANFCIKGLAVAIPGLIVNGVLLTLLLGIYNPPLLAEWVSGAIEFMRIARGTRAVP